MGGSLSLSTSPHRRSLEALGLLHNSGFSCFGFNRDDHKDENVCKIKSDFNPGRPPSRALSSRSLSGLGWKTLFPLKHVLSQVLLHKKLYNFSLKALLIIPILVH